MIDDKRDHVYSGEIDFQELLRVVWEGRFLITLVTGLAATLSVALALSMPNIYQSTATLAPKSDGETGGLSQLAAQYSGLASLAGIRLSGVDGGGMSKSAIALEKMKSLFFFERHLYEDVLLDLMAATSWDSVDRKIEYDDELYDVTAKNWLRDVAPPLQVRPSAQEAHLEFLKVFSVSEDKQTGLILVSVEHLSPDVAKHWVELIVQRVSEDLRAEDILEAENAIKFLGVQREKTSLLTLDEVFAQLIEEQTKVIMLANVSKNYVFNVIDPPVAPELKMKPSRALISLIGALVGAMFGVSLVIFRHYISWDE